MKCCFIAILSIALLSSCSNSKKNGASGFENVNVAKVVSQLHTSKSSPGKNEHLTINKLEDNTELKLSDVVDSIWGIKLETTLESLIGQIDKIKMVGGEIYVLDKYKSKTLRKFNSEGKYITTIGKNGKGPGEYYEPTDFFVGNGEIVIYDQFKRILNFYTTDGVYVKEKSMPFILTSFHIFDNNNYLFHTCNSDNYHIPDILDFGLLWGDSTMSLKNRGAYRKKNKYNNFRANNNTDFFNGSLFYHEPFSDTIFRIEPDGKMYYDYVIELGNKKVPEDLLLEGNFDRFRKEVSNTDYYIYLGDQVVTTDYLYLPISVKGKIFHTVYSNKTKKILYGDMIWNDLNYVYNLYKIINCQDNTLVGYMNASDLADNVNRMKANDELKLLDKRVVEYVSDVNDSDNPIVLFFRLKDGEGAKTNN